MLHLFMLHLLSTRDEVILKVKVTLHVIFFKSIKPSSALLVTSHCALRRKDSLRMLARRFGISIKSGGHPQGDMHMVAARLGFERAMVGTRWATSCPDSMDRLRKHYSYLVGG